MALSWLLLVLFLFGLPLWSYLFNDVWGYGEVLCTVPAEEVSCGNTDDYMQVARKLGRVVDHLEWSWGCSCEQGVFADWACTIDGTPYFSVSYYVSTAPGTGALALFSAFPILFLWFYGGNNVNTMRECVKGGKAEEKQGHIDIITITQGLFQVFYGLFQFASVCVFPHFHGPVVIAFVLAEVIHFLALARSADTNIMQGRIVVGLVVAGLLALTALPAISLLADPGTASAFQRHAFYLGEAAGFSIIASIPVVLVWVPPTAAKLREVDVAADAAAVDAAAAQLLLTGVA